MSKATLRISTLLVLLAANQYAFGNSTHHDENGFYTWADVVDVTPLVSRETVRKPVKHCEVVTVEPERHVVRRDRRESRVFPALLGGVLGGAIGNRFGDGNGRKAMTVLGAFAGASIAANAARDRDHYEYAEPQQRRVCNTTYKTETVRHVDGYLVTYRYLGREFEKKTENHPGKRLKIYVSVDPEPASQQIASI